MKTMATTKVKKVVKERATRVPVSELNLRKAASRLLSSALVSPEIQYIQRVLGASATQEDLDAKVVAVRSMPWASIVEPD
jgi:hypothetical protein